MSESGKSPSVEIDDSQLGAFSVTLGGDWLVSTGPPSFDSVRSRFDAVAGSPSRLRRLLSEVCVLHPGYCTGRRRLKEPWSPIDEL